jgi:hypothetical protein
VKNWFLVIIFLLSGSALADMVANQSNPLQSLVSPSRAVADGCGTVLTQEMAGCLGGFNVPRFEDLDRNYAIHPPRNVPACARDWQRIERMHIHPQTPAVSMSELEKSANQYGVSLEALHHAVAVFLQNQNRIPEQRYISIVDFDKSGHVPRWFFFDLQTGAVTKFKVSAGRSSDPDHDGIADRFSNQHRSNASSLGCAVSGETYDGRHAHSIRLHGLENTNYNICDRSVVVHQTGSYEAGEGRSNGCLAVDSTKNIYQIVNGKRVATAGIAAMLGQGGLVCNWKTPGKYKQVDKASDYHQASHKYRSHRRHYKRRRRHVQYSYNYYY